MVSVNKIKLKINAIPTLSNFVPRGTRHIACNIRSRYCTRLCPSRLSVCIGDSSRCSEEGVKIFFFFFFLVPQLYLWGSPLLGEIFAYVTVLFFFNPTIKVVTFRLRGWCMLGVFLLPAFTRLGHERQDLLSLCDEMHVCTD